MTFVHGKGTYIALTNNNLSTYVTTSQIESNSDSHDVTTYGQDAHKFKGGLTNGTATMSGVYDNSTSAGPRAVITPLIGANTTLIRRPEGTGTGLAQDSVEVLVTKYVETNPVADMVTWSCDMQLSGTVTRTVQT
jgi:hypothetical protein